MIWHIFKKDWTLLWRFAAGVGALHFALMGALLRIGRFQGAPLSGRGLAAGDDGALYSVTGAFPMLAMFASLFLIVAIVQQDAIPGVRQDWLVRPIRRRDLFLAKLLAVLFMVIGPIFAADVSGALFNGFPIGQAVAAALGRSVWLCLIPFSEVFAMAALTRNMMEAVVGGTVATAGWYVASPLLRSRAFPFVDLSSVAWMNQVIHLGVALAGIAVLLVLQYRWRKTLAARVLTVGVFVLYVLIPGVPWPTAFALEERLSPSRGAADSIRISFAPDAEPQEDRPVGPPHYAGRSDASVLLPIRLTGLPGDGILNGDTSEVRLIAPDGQTQTLAYQMGFQVWRENGGNVSRGHVTGQPGSGEKLVTYVMQVPRALYARLAEQPIRLEIDYSLTLLRPSDAQTLPATGGDQRTRVLGWCGTKLSEAGGDVLFGCIQAGRAPACASIVLEHTPSGARNLGIAYCRPDYSPFRRNYTPDSLSRFTEKLPFGNTSGIDLYPVKESMLPESQVKAKAYEPQEHFSRQLIIPEIRLKDWAAPE